MKLWCFNDAHDWGTALQSAAAKRGIDAHLFDNPRAPTSGIAFMHMHHHSSVRMLHKRVMAIMSMNPELTLLPDYQSSVLFDNKLEQAIQLSKWMPRTRVFYTPGGARRFLETQPKFPFVSKTSEGKSYNVRTINTLDDAKLEIRQAFSDLGIKCRHGLQQRSYLLWQDYVGDGGGELRVAAIGSKRLILRKFPDGGSTAVSVLSEPILAALSHANEFFAEHSIKWGSVDLIFDKAHDRWFILNTSVAWTMHHFHDCQFIDGAEVLDRNGSQVWEVLLDDIEAGKI